MANKQVIKLPLWHGLVKGPGVSWVQWHLKVTNKDNNRCYANNPMLFFLLVFIWQAVDKDSMLICFIHGYAGFN